VALRLVNGTTVAEGRLEVQLGTGEWTTLCSSFDDYNAAVACRQLGMQGGRAARAAATFGAGSGLLRALNASVYRYSILHGRGEQPGQVQHLQRQLRDQLQPQRRRGCVL
jgi:hypothetical protein